MTHSTRTTRGRSASAGEADIMADGGWGETAAEGRDWKKLVLVVGLGILSWVATYVGMLELIESNMGELPLVHKLIIGFSVAMLMTMIIWLLDQIFAPIGFFLKLIYIAGYVFLSVISVGFGFGFYWKVLESRSETTRSAESAVTQVQGSLHAASTRLEQLQATLIQLTEVSTHKAGLETASGTSCPNSRPGDGPRRKLREEDAARFSFASAFVKGRVGAVKGDVTALNGELVKISAGGKNGVDVKDGTRNDSMRSLSRRLDMTVTGFNAFRTDPQLKQIRADLAERADKTVFPDTKGGTFACPDPQLQTALKGVVRAIDQLPELEKPKIAAVEGSEATIEAFRRLTATMFGAMAFKLPPSADELRQLQQKAVQSVESSATTAKLAAVAGETVGLSKRDYIPLAIALFVDLCLLLVSMGRPVHNRLNTLVPKMKAAEQGPVYQILAKFTDIHKDTATREKFEIFRHVVFDYSGDFYVAVPLDAPKRANPDARLKLQQEAHLLANLFASFEKEKIFKRAMLPTNATVRRKLDRQGSKFAGSESFRVYRFRDGAWSDIILGAVMGASRRAEHERRLKALAEGHTLSMPEATGVASDTVTAVSAATAPPTLAIEPMIPADPSARRRPSQADFPLVPPAAQARAAAVQAPRGVPPSHDYRRTAAALDSVAAARRDVPEAEVAVVQADNNNTMPGGRSRTADRRKTLGRAAGRNRSIFSEATSDETEAIPRFMRPTEPQTTADDSTQGFAQGFAENVIPLPRAALDGAGDTSSTRRPPAAFDGAGDTSSTRRPPARPADESMAESPHPTVPVTQVVAPVVPQVASEITAHVDMTRGPEGIDVVLSRETATFRMPVSEGRLPAALAALVGRQAASAIQGVGEASLASFSEAISTARPATILLPAPEADPINAERAALAAQAVLEAADDASETASVHVNGVPYPSDLGGTQRATG